MKGVNMNQMLKMFKDTQEKLQKDMEKLEVEGSSGGDMVRVKMNGKKEVLSVKIDQEIIKPEEVETLEDLILSAFNNATEKADEALKSKLPSIPGLNIPGLF